MAPNPSNSRAPSLRVALIWPSKIGRTSTWRGRRQFAEDLRGKQLKKTWATRCDKTREKVKFTSVPKYRLRYFLLQNLPLKQNAKKLAMYVVSVVVGINIWCHGEQKWKVGVCVHGKSTDLVGEDSDVFVEWFRRADVAAGNARLTRCTRR